MFTCDMCGKIVEDNVKRITFSHMFNLPFGKGHWIPDNVFDVCEDCGKKLEAFIGDDNKKPKEEL